MVFPSKIQLRQMDGIFLQDRGTHWVGGSTTRLYKSTFTNKYIVCKKVRESSTELYFHEFVSLDSSDIYVAPIDYVFHDGERFLVFPYVGQDVFTLAMHGFWSTHEHITMTFYEEMLKKMDLFHIRYKMAIGDISPNNIVYDAKNGKGSFIDLELLRYPFMQRSVQSPVMNNTLCIDVPQKDVNLRSFSRVGTPGFRSFDKLFSDTFDVFENDRYALATTLYTMITNGAAPTLYMTGTCTRKEWSHLHEVALEHLQTFMTNGCYHWSIASKLQILDYIRTTWK